MVVIVTGVRCPKIRCTFEFLNSLFWIEAFDINIYYGKRRYFARVCGER